MKFALITDQHFMVRDSSEYFRKNYTRFYNEVFFPTLKEHGVKTIVGLGDTFEDRKKMNILGLEHAREVYFDPAEKNGIEIITILGNHDVYYRNTNEVHALDLIEKAYKNVRVIHDTAVLDLDGFKLGLVSWINKENYESRLEFMRTCEIDVLAGHFEISGFEMTKGNFCDGGMSQDLFKRFDEVWSGHFHIASKQGCIRYLGNPSQTNKGDVGYDRGFYIFDTDTRELTFYANPFKVYDTIYYDESYDILQYDFEKYRDQMISMYITAWHKVDKTKLNLFVDELNKVTYSLDVIETESLVSDIQKEANKVEYTSHLEMITSWIDREFTIEEDQKNLKNMMNELYTEALQMSEDD